MRFGLATAANRGSRERLQRLIGVHMERVARVAVPRLSKANEPGAGVAQHSTHAIARNAASEASAPAQSAAEALEIQRTVSGRATAKDWRSPVIFFSDMMGLRKADLLKGVKCSRISQNSTGLAL